MESDKNKSFVDLTNSDENYEFNFVKKTDPEIKLETLSNPPSPVKHQPIESIFEQPDESVSSEKRQKLNDGQVKKRLRKLGTSQEEEEAAKKLKSSNSFPFFKYFGLSAVIVFLGIGLSNDGIRNDLIETYRNQYNLLFHGKVNYCDQTFDFGNVTTALKKNVIGQDLVIKELSTLFTEHSTRTSAVILGNTGVGKTLTSKLIGDNFQWIENVNYFIWSSSESNKTQFKKLGKTIKNVSNCGHNLLFVDDLDYKDGSVVLEIENFIRTKSPEKNPKLIIFYIVNLHKYSEKDKKSYQNKVDSIKATIHLPVIEFRDLTEEDGLKCIKLQCAILGITLTDEETKDVIASIVPTRSGCKHVYSKIALYKKLE